MILAALLGAWCALATGDARADDVLARYECARCHVIDGEPAAPITRSCVDCHARIEDGTLGAALQAPVDPATLARWRGRITHFVDVPSLAGLDGRVRRAWIERFLLAPHDVRPGLEETMPRLPITPDDARAIAARLVPREPDETPLGDAGADGRAVMEAKGCALCHRFTGVDALAVRAAPVALDGAALAAAVRHAPDLRHTRARMPERAIVAWLEDPRAHKRDARMPRIAMTRAEATAMARYIVSAPLVDALPPEAGLRVPVLARRVTFAEVDERVFARSCRHCHADAALARGDGGPGNTGGFGYAGRGLSFASDGEVAEGSLDEQGERRSLFAPLEEGPLAGTPRLLAHLIARRSEERGAPIEGVLGMPLALPALGDEELQLVASWIAQGRPR